MKNKPIRYKIFALFTISKNLYYLKRNKCIFGRKKESKDFEYNMNRPVTVNGGKFEMKDQLLYYNIY